jgi:hypothetical protein
MTLVLPAGENAGKEEQRRLGGRVRLNERSYEKNPSVERNCDKEKREIQTCDPRRREVKAVPPRVERGREIGATK